MDEIRVILADGSSFEIAEFSVPLHIVVNGTQEELIALWNTLTPDNLKSVSVTVDGVTALTNADVVLDGSQFVGGSGTITGHFYMHGNLVSGDTTALEAKNADMKVALGVLGVTEETEVE